MTYGRYRKGTALAYRLDPRTKTLFVLVLTVATFMAASGPGLGVVAIASLGALAASGMGARDVAGTLRPFVWLMAFVLVFNAAFASAGLVFGLESVVRFVIVLLGTSSLMVTTTPTELTDGTDLLLRPLRRLGANTDDVSLAVGLTLRFVPVLMEELSRVRDAQVARHARLDEGGPLRRLRAAVPVLVPTFASALRRSRTLALALENRGYGLPQERERTCLRSYHFRAADGGVFAVCLGLIVVGVVA